MNFPKGLGWLALLMLADCGIAKSQPPRQDRLGLVSEQPESGTFVETREGFMVPYRETIPGTMVSFEMVPIPGGRFLLGSPESELGHGPEEGRQVSVIVEPFWMAKHEVTWKEYQVYMRLVAAFKEIHRQGIREITEENEVDVVTAPSVLYDLYIPYGAGDGPDTPAVTMTQFAAKQYTKWLSLLVDDFYRLPSEAEWEYACRAGSQTAYCFGDDEALLGEYAWFEGNAEDMRHDVGQKLPNAWGLHDMHGNVAEWVLDAYTPEGYAAIGDGMVPAKNAIQWPNSIYPGVARGGSWEHSPIDLRSAARLGSSEDWSDEDPQLPNSPWWHTTSPATGVGFRLIRPLAAPVDAELRDAYWGANVDEVLDDVTQSIETSGRGSNGVVDPQLTGVIERLTREGHLPRHQR